MLDNLIRISLFVSMCAACGGGKGGDDPAAIDACQLLTREDASALFGQTANATTGAEVVDPALLGECLWKYEAADYSNQFLAIYVWDNQDDLHYDELEGAQPLSIGKQGYIVTAESGVDIGWEQDSLAVYLNYLTVGPSVPAASTRVEAAKALAVEVSTRL